MDSLEPPGVCMTGRHGQGCSWLLTANNTRWAMQSEGHIVLDTKLQPPTCHFSGARVSTSCCCSQLNRLLHAALPASGNTYRDATKLQCVETPNRKAGILGHMLSQSSRPVQSG